MRSIAVEKHRVAPIRFPWYWPTQGDADASSQRVRTSATGDIAAACARDARNACDRRRFRSR